MSNDKQTQTKPTHILLEDFAKAVGKHPDRVWKLLERLAVGDSTIPFHDWKVKVKDIGAGFFNLERNSLNIPEFEAMVIAGTFGTTQARAVVTFFQGISAEHQSLKLLNNGIMTDNIKLECKLQSYKLENMSLKKESASFDEAYQRLQDNGKVLQAQNKVLQERVTDSEVENHLLLKSLTKTKARNDILEIVAQMHPETTRIAVENVQQQKLNK